MQLDAKHWRMFPRIQRKYPVSCDFLKLNKTKIEKFVYYALFPRAVIKHVAKRRRRNHKQSVIIDCYHLRRVQWDPEQRKHIKSRKRSVREWSKRMVCYLRKTYGINEYVEDLEKSCLPPEEVSKQLKEQLELLKNGRRKVPLMSTDLSAGDESATSVMASTHLHKCSEEHRTELTDNKSIDSSTCMIFEFVDATPIVSADKTSEKTENTSLEATADSTPTSLVISNSLNNKKVDLERETGSEPAAETAVENMAGSTNFLDMLMSKVGVSNVCSSDDLRTGDTAQNPVANGEHEPQHEPEHLTDSSDEFLGFEESERLPGMLLTPLVPLRENAAFISESLNAYMRENALDTNDGGGSGEGDKVAHRYREGSLDGLVTPGCVPPPLDMPAVPENLQKLRTVAERRHYLQKFSKNHKLAVINNEAMIYRELQRKLRLHKSKTVSQQLLQASNSHMPFTREGWLAASFVTTEYNKYYYQSMEVDHGRDYVRLRGVRGNNDERNKAPYISFVSPAQQQKHNKCTFNCVDRLVWRDFKPIKISSNKVKLNQETLPASLFPPCPLSHKPFQRPLDDEVASLLLAGGSMAVVRMPTVELEVFPELGRPLHEVAKRYLQYILPHHDISREWAEFSVSTLQAPHTLKEAEAVAANSLNNYRRKSFTFAIPYLNDRNHILVRRVVDRSEELDQSFTQVSDDDLSMSTSVPVADLSFRANLDQNDKILLECAEIVSDMINCVAISCSENSFIKQDPDGIYGDDIKDDIGVKEQIENDKLTNKSINATKPAEGKLQGVQSKKQNRLLLELKRLNATIIDAGAKAEKTTKPCGKEYCALGCVCTSLIDEMPLRQHCGKSKCVIECSCKGSKQSRIMRLEMDGRAITTEDAFMLRRQATARLARMEKEFTSTVVLTENETLLINESQYDKKRRCTKAPKRYEDFADTDEDFTRTTPVKLANSAVVSIEATDSSASNSGFMDMAMELREPVYVQSDVLQQLKHCSVPVLPLQDTKNMVSWCMVHELYKCFCGGRAIEGKPLQIEKEETTMVHSVDTEVDYVMAPVKGRYSFERLEDVVIKNTSSPVPLIDAEDKIDVKIDDGSIMKTEISLRDKGLYDEYGSTTPEHLLAGRERYRRGRPSEDTIIRSYYSAWSQSCRRVVPVPRKCYFRLNRKRKPDVIEFIEENENDKTRLLLNEHILRSVYYHKHETERQRREESIPADDDVAMLAKLSKKSKDHKQVNDESVTATKKAKSTFHMPVSQAKERQKRLSSVCTSDIERKRAKVSSAEPTTTTVTTATTTDFVDLTITNNDTPATSTSTVRKDFAGMPLSISPSPNSNSGSAMLADISGNTTTHATLSDLGFGEGVISSDAFKQFYKGVIKNMNNLVSKKMQDIDMALKRESKVIPSPNEEILCIIKWTNFLDAYTEGFVYIWEVKLHDDRFLAATIANQMPLVMGAVGVVNITAVPLTRLPLLGRMLRQQLRTDHMDKLAIVMQGRSGYWLVKGFLRPDSASACAKPTPQTHPALTKKINMLCTLLVKQRIRDFKRRQLHPPQQQSANMCEQQSHSIDKIPALIELTASRQQPPETVTPALSPIASLLTQKPTNCNAEAESKRMPALTKVASPTAVVPTTVAPSNAVGKTVARTNALQRYANMKTNIEYRKVTTEDIDEIHPPEFHTEDHRWLVLDLYNDFSHIFVPAFRDLVSLDRIHKVMAFSKQKQKIVKLQFFQDAPFDAFVTPSSARKIYFGPLKLNMRPPLLILLQSVDGQMMLREVYQVEHKIPNKSSERTTAFWILQINGQIHFEIDTDAATLPDRQQQRNFQKTITQRAPKKRANARHNTDKKQTDDENGAGAGAGVGAGVGAGGDVDDDDDADDDCMIIESASPSTAATKATTEVSRPPERLNFSIQTEHNSNHLQITALPDTTSLPGDTTQPLLQLPMNTGSVPGALGTFMPLLGLQSAGIVRSVAPAPKDAPYGATIYISSLNSAVLSANGNDVTAVTSAMRTPQMSVTNAQETQPKLAPIATSNAAKRRRFSVCVPITSSGTASSISTIGSTTITKVTDVMSASTSSTASTGRLLNATNIRPVTSSTTTTAVNTAVKAKIPTPEAKAMNTSVSTIGSTTITKFTDTPSRNTNVALTLLNQMKKPLSANGDNLFTEADMPAASIIIKPRSGVDNSTVDMSISASASASLKRKSNNESNNTERSAIVRSGSSTDFSSKANTKITLSMSNSKVSINTPTSKASLNSSTPTSAAETPKIMVSPSSLSGKKGQGGLTTKILNFHGATLPETSPIKTIRASISTRIKTQNGGKKIITKPVHQKLPTPNASKASFDSDVSVTGSGATPIVLYPNKSAQTSTAQTSKLLNNIYIYKMNQQSSLPSTSSVTTANTVDSKLTKPIITVRPALPKQRNSSSTVPIKINLRKNPVNEPQSNGDKNSSSAASSSPPLSSRSTTANTNNTTAPIGAASCVYGFFYCSIPGATKYLAKRTKNYFLIKVPTVGTLQINSLDGVNNYLNRHMSCIKDLKFKGKLPTAWKFLPQDRWKSTLRKVDCTSTSSDGVGVGVGVGAGETKSEDNVNKSKGTNVGTTKIGSLQKTQLKQTVKVTVLPKQNVMQKEQNSVKNMKKNNNNNNNAHSSETILIED